MPVDQSMLSVSLRYIARHRDMLMCQHAGRTAASRSVPFCLQLTQQLSAVIWTLASNLPEVDFYPLDKTLSQPSVKACFEDTFCLE